MADPDREMAPVAPGDPGLPGNQPATVGAAWQPAAAQAYENDGFPQTVGNAGSAVDTMRSNVRETRRELFNRQTMNEVRLEAHLERGELPGAFVAEPDELQLTAWVARPGLRLATEAGRNAHRDAVFDIFDEPTEGIVRFILEALAALPAHRQRGLTWPQQTASRGVEFYLADRPDNVQRPSDLYAGDVYARWVELLEALIPPYSPTNDLPALAAHHERHDWASSGTHEPVAARQHYKRWYEWLQAIAKTLLATLDELTDVPNGVVVMRAAADAPHGLRAALDRLDAQVLQLVGGGLDEPATYQWLDEQQDARIRALWFQALAEAWEDQGLPGHAGQLTTWPNAAGGDCFPCAFMASMGYDGRSANPNMGGDGNVAGLNGGAWGAEHLTMRGQVAQQAALPANSADYPAYDPTFRVNMDVRSQVRLNTEPLSWQPVVQDNLDRFGQYTFAEVDALYTDGANLLAPNRPVRNRDWVWAASMGRWPRSFMRERNANGDVVEGGAQGWGVMKLSWGPFEGAAWDELTHRLPAADPNLPLGGGRLSAAANAAVNGANVIEDKALWKRRLLTSGSAVFVSEDPLAFHHRLQRAYVQTGGYLDYTTWGRQHPTVQQYDPSGMGGFVYWYQLGDVEVTAHRYKRYIIVWKIVNETEWRCNETVGEWESRASARIDRFRIYRAFGNPAWRPVHIAWTQGAYLFGNIEGDEDERGLMHYAPVLSLDGTNAPRRPVGFDFAGLEEEEVGGDDPFNFVARGVPPPPMPLPHRVPPVPQYGGTTPPPAEWCVRRGAVPPLPVEDDPMGEDEDEELRLALALSMCTDGG
ncbi:MAG: hypothetical protein ACKVI4_16690, partial [Actinomycetales bacterium]